MIIGPARIHPLGDFVAGLQAAAQSLVWVKLKRGGCTGWVIAPGLVVIPGYVLSTELDPQVIQCRAADGTASADARVVFDPGPRSGEPRNEELRPVLLRLTGYLPVQPLRMDLTTPVPGQRLLVLQHPGGDPQAQISIGRAVGGDAPGLLVHDAATMPGSGGAPVLSADSMGLVGMHVSARPDGFNQAIPIARLLDDLHGSPLWAEIAVPHRLADLGPAGAAAIPAAGPDLLPFALRWNFPAAECTEAEREALRPLVIDPEAPIWTLLPDERRSLIKEAETLPGPTPAANGAQRPPGQHVIDRILAGPPFDLTEVDEGALPYWLQASTWFAGAVEGLPSPADVHRALAVRRVRSRLHAMIGGRLWGREPELATMRAWLARPQAGPLLITGVGGAGKSALIAEFARTLPPRTVLLWLDFDRADVAPDDAESVLAALAEQLAVQLDAGAGPVPPDAGRLAELLGTIRDRSPLLVLDGFEIAQHAPRHEEIWTVLSRLLGERPALHVVVSGRATVPGLALGGHRAEQLALAGLPPQAAEAWLRDQGVTDRATLETVLETADGVPLILKLAARLIAAGGDAGDLPQQLVEGYLYQRILDRVVDPALQPLAHDALVLRRLTAPMLTAVLGDRMPAGREAGTVLSQLARELTVAADPAATPDLAPAAELSLRMRPEVRTATMRLLERENNDRVREIDARALDWYTSHGAEAPAEAAELVYHRLRLGDVPGAAAAWVTGCASLLLGADEEIPEQFPHARAWLRDRVGDAAVVAEVWEPEMYAEVRHLIKRGNLPAAAARLASRPERSPESPLLEYDAWLRHRLHGDTPGARRIIGRPRHRPGRVLAAWLAAEDGDPRASDDLLAPLDNAAAWEHQTDPAAAPLAVRAARIRLTVDLEAEERLAEAVHADPTGRLAAELRRMLLPGDVVLPSLSTSLEGEVGHELESLRSPVHLPTAPGEEHAAFVEQLEGERFYRTRTDDLWQQVGARTDSAWTARQAGITMADILPGSSSPELELGLDLAVRAVRRWFLAVRDMFLADVLAAVQLPGAQTLALSAARSLNVFHGQPLTLRDGRLLAEAVRDESAPKRMLDVRRQWPVVAREEDRLGRRTLLTGQSGQAGLVSYLIAPRPLEQLTRAELGIPENLKDGRS